MQDVDKRFAIMWHSQKEQANKLAQNVKGELRIVELSPDTTYTICVSAHGDGQQNASVLEVNTKGKNESKLTTADLVKVVSQKDVNVLVEDVTNTTITFNFETAKVFEGIVVNMTTANNTDPQLRTVKGNLEISNLTPETFYTIKGIFKDRDGEDKNVSVSNTTKPALEASKSDTNTSSHTTVFSNEPVKGIIVEWKENQHAYHMTGSMAISELVPHTIYRINIAALRGGGKKETVIEVQTKYWNDLTTIISPHKDVTVSAVTTNLTTIHFNFDVSASDTDNIVFTWNEYQPNTSVLKNVLARVNVNLSIHKVSPDTTFNITVNPITDDDQEPTITTQAVTTTEAATTEAATTKAATTKEAATTTEAATTKRAGTATRTVTTGIT
jgi:hypothetical protein